MEPVIFLLGLIVGWLSFVIFYRVWRKEPRVISRLAFRMQVAPNRFVDADINVTEQDTFDTAADKMVWIIDLLGVAHERAKEDLEAETEQRRREYREKKVEAQKKAG